MTEQKKLRLNQIIAIANGEKARKQKVLTKTYQNLQKSTLFEGISKRYAALDEDGERLPNEDKRVQLTVQQAMKEAIEVMEDMFNVIATQDIGNCSAKADVKVDGNVILSGVPATHLIFLEKQLIDIATFVDQFPVLDPAEDWSFDDIPACYASKVKETHRTKKVPEVIVKYDATEEHPAQTEMTQKDIITGYWSTIKFSGNIKKIDKDAMLDRIRKLSQSLKIAREEANSQEVTRSDLGTKVLEYIFES